MGNGKTATQYGTKQIDPNGAPELIKFNFCYGPILSSCTTRVVVEDIQAAISSDGGVDSILHVIGFTDVCWNGLNLAASPIDFTGKICILQMIAITQRELCPFSGKQPCSCAANATGGASDQHALVC